MQCPFDGTELTRSERQGVEIDYCPKCRGVWLDRGELDKIIERSSTMDAPAHGGNSPDPVDAHAHKRSGKKHKRESFLSELFDF